MEMIRVTLVALMLACAACGPHTPLSGRNQYEAHEDGPDSIQLLNEATDRPISVHMPHRFNVLSNTIETKKTSVPELQVGCEEGLIKTRKKRSENENSRLKRSYFPWSNYVLKAPSYQISRPYVIPIWGPPGRVPIYYPPQPIFLNPGYPPSNPPNGLVPPRNGYLPPKGYLPPGPTTTTTPAPDETTIYIGNKFGDDLPIWDVEDSPNVILRPTTKPPPQNIPTRRRRPNTQTSTHPPLVHKVSNEQSSANNLSPIIPSPSGGSSVTTVRPPNNNFVPQVPPAAQQPPRTQPSNCVWAIIRCCSTSTTEYSNQCFEQNNCFGFFWDSSPCESNFARAAIASASQYYLNNGR